MTMGIKLGILIWITVVLFSVAIRSTSNGSEKDDDLL